MKKINLEDFELLTDKKKCLVMWEWLAETGTDEKMEFFYIYLNIDEDKIENYNIPAFECYACETALQYVPDSPEGNDKRCDHCPIDWGFPTCYNSHCTDDGKPLFAQWEDELNDTEDRQELAQNIYELTKRTWKD